METSMAPSFDVPILFIIFNRPDITKRGFEAIRNIRPARLYVLADGPRKNRPDDIEKCKKSRDYVMSHIDWPCSIVTLFRDENLGCKGSVSAGLTWFFQQVEEGIVLEDDDVPDPSFFRYCKELLEKFRDDERVMCIDGTSVQDQNPNFRNADSYYFSRIPMGWGWASWKRAWKTYDVTMRAWPALCESGSLKKRFANAGAYERFAHSWDDYLAGTTDSYDGQWVFACVANDGLCIAPCRNLVTNIGFGEDATHTSTTKNSRWANLPTFPVQFPMKHPTKVAIDHKADAFLYRHFFGIDKKLRHQITRPIKNTFPGLYKNIKRFLASEPK